MSTMTQAEHCNQTSGWFLVMNGSSCSMSALGLSFKAMAMRRILGWVVLLLITAGFLLPHWHKDWNDQGCQLCHVRNLPSLYSPIAVGPARPITTKRHWQA